MPNTKESYNFEKIFNLAHEVLNNSYSPYSKFKVGAVLSMKDGNYILGTNIENASYGLTICAERAALFSAYSQGYTKKDIKSMIILSNNKKIISPCGACRQVMSELMDKDAIVIMSNIDKEHKVLSVAELLPFNFSKEDLT